MAAEIVAKNLSNVLKSVYELAAIYSVDVRLVAVSKTFSVDSIIACYDKGQRHFGENYIDEFESKAKELVSRGVHDINWHFIGRLQSNKLKKICEIPGLWCIETLDNKKHADLLQSIMANDKKPLKA
uniref:YggS family pyridoxal phosphate-dependent enzyme n=1 Tax=Meloidogyne javanica TaxID=6303 RepID=A0A915NDZ9_MELJA